MNPYYKDYAEFLSEHFQGKVQKISVNTGNVCPNRDGTLGRGGCIYCNNASFTPDYAAPLLSVTEQLDRGIDFFRGKYPEMRYLAYFQSYTSTNGDVDALMAQFREAAAHSGVAGIVIGTRPDCMPNELLSKLAELNRRTSVIIEYGAESAHNATLQLINRCHTWEQTVDAVSRTAKDGIPVGLHLILGLPGETQQMMLETVDAVNALPIATVKFHQLQIVRGTALARAVEEGTLSVDTYSVDEYISLCVSIVYRLRRDIAIDRFTSQTPAELLISPRWGLKNYQFTHRLLHRLAEEAGQHS